MCDNDPGLYTYAYVPAGFEKTHPNGIHCWGGGVCLHNSQTRFLCAGLPPRSLWQSVSSVVMADEIRSLAVCQYF